MKKTIDLAIEPYIELLDQLERHPLSKVEPDGDRKRHHPADPQPDWVLCDAAPEMEFVQVWGRGKGLRS